MNELDSKIKTLNESNLDALSLKEAELKKINDEINKIEWLDTKMTNDLASNKEFSEYYQKQNELYNKKNQLESEINTLKESNKIVNSEIILSPVQKVSVINWAKNNPWKVIWVLLAWSIVYYTLTTDRDAQGNPIDLLKSVPKWQVLPKNTVILKQNWNWEYIPQ